jgi:DNA-binding beta-propeller fold protein YncE
MKRSIHSLVVGLAFVVAGSAQAQGPEIPFEAEDALSGFPNDIHLGEVAGVARNSDGEIFVYTRTGNPVIAIGTSRAVSHGGARIFRFDEDGEYEGEIGQGIYGALYAQQVRVDPQDNVWIVDQMSGQVIKFDPDGRIQMVFSRKPEAMRIPAPEPPPMDQRDPGEGREGESQGNISVADGIVNARIAKYGPSRGEWIMNWGVRGSGPGQFDIVHGIAIDAQDNVYVADYLNERIQVFDTEGNYQREMSGFGAPMAICMTPPPNQVLYVSNSNPPDNYDVDAGGEIYKVALDGTILGHFGTVGKNIGQFGTVNAIDCRGENELLVGEIGNWRVQRITLQTNE